jgi:outer membrane protein TolC
VVTRPRAPSEEIDMAGWTARVGAVAIAFATCAACVGPSQLERYHAQREAAGAETSAATATEADPFARTEVLSRRALVTHVLERNPDLEAARATWQAALARYPQEVSLEDPTFGYGVRPRSFSSDEVNPAQDFELSQAFPFPGKLGLRGEMALASADAAGEGVAAERLRVATLASSLFDEYWLAARALETNAEHQTLLDELYQVALARYAAGSGSRQDVLAAETERTMLLHAGIEVASNRRIVEERINTLLHRAPSEPLPRPASALDAVPEHDLDAAALTQEALSRRPELRERAAEIRAREAAVALAEREYLPDFRLRGGYEGSWQETPLRPFVGVELNLPIQLERRRGALDEANARLARERSRTRSLEDRVRFEVTVAVERLREAQHLLMLTRERLLPATQDRVASARSAFETGQASFLELVDAERALRSAELGESEAQAAVSRRHADLSRALGEEPAIEEVTR